MACDKEKYENLINGSSLFSFDREKEFNAYQRESRRMVEYLYCYLMSINRNKYEPFGYEITTVAMRCIKSFNDAKGKFLHYFMAAWKQEYRHLYAQEKVSDTLHGIRISEQEKRHIIRLFKLSDEIQFDGSLCNIKNRLSESLGLSSKELNSIVEIASIEVHSGVKTGENETEVDLISRIADPFDMESEVFSSETLMELLTMIDQCYKSLQERQKTLISDILTVKCFSLLKTKTIPENQFAFINSRLLSELSTGKPVPTQRDIADAHNKHEASISRTYALFCNRLKQRLIADNDRLHCEQ